MTSLLTRGDRRTGPSRRPTSDPDRIRTLSGVALRPTGVTLILICAVVLVVLVSSNSDLAGAVGAVAAVWLAVHQVSLTVTDAPLGVLPLLPTGLLVWWVARVCANAVTPETDVREAGRVVAAAVAAPTVVTLISFAVIGDAAAVIPLASPPVFAALATVIVIHLIAACAGIVAVTGRAACARRGIPDWVPATVVPAARAAGLLFAAGAVTVAASLVWSWSEVGALLDDASGVVGLIGLTCLSVLYLPNAAIGAIAVLAGGVAHAGGGTTVSLFEVVTGPVPPVPVLGGVPTEATGTGWPLLMLVPVVVGVILGRSCARLRLPVQETSYAVTIAAAAVGVLAASVGLVAGGELGTYGFVGVEPGLLGLIVFGWLVVPGLAVGAFLASRNAASSPEADASDVSDDPAEATTAEGEEAVLEIRRLERPAVRYRAVPTVEQETAIAGEAAAPQLEGAEAEDAKIEEPEVETSDAEASVDDPADEPAADPAADPVADAEAVVEAEIVEEPAANPTEAVDSIEVDVVPAPDEAVDAESDLPDGPVTPRD